MSFADAGLGLPGASLGAATKPCNFVLDQILQGFLPLGLGMEKLLFLLQKLTVATAGAQKTVRVNTAQFDHFGGHIFKEITVVADDDGCERRVLQQLLEPLEADEVEMVGRLVEQQNVGLLYQGFGDSQSLSPSPGQLGSLLLEVFEAGAAQGLAGACLPF